MRLVTLLAVSAGILATPAEAQTPSFRLAVSSAEAIVAGCAARARGRGQSHAIAVVDAGGGLVAALRMEGNGPAIMDFAEAKARAVAGWGFSTEQMASAARETPGFAAAPRVVTVPGGLPIFTADRKTLLGAVGVSGEAPADDAACAAAGVEAAGLSWGRPG